MVDAFGRILGLFLLGLGVLLSLDVVLAFRVFIFIFVGFGD